MIRRFRVRTILSPPHSVESFSRLFCPVPPTHLQWDQVSMDRNCSVKISFLSWSQEPLGPPNLRRCLLHTLIQKGVGNFEIEHKTCSFLVGVQYPLMNKKRPFCIVHTDSIYWYHLRNPELATMLQETLPKWHFCHISKRFCQSEFNFDVVL